MHSITGLTPPLPVRTIYCIGRNYRKHAQELGNRVPDQPLIFLKPTSSIIGHGESIILPLQSSDVHHEVELVVAIGKGGKNIIPDQAIDHIAGYGIGIDVTARDLQQQAKNQGHPWGVAKGFDTFAPLSQFIPVQADTNFSAMELELAVNGEVRQRGTTDQMIFPVTELVSYLSAIFHLQPGDLIFTGTPEGVSRIQAGDQIKATLNSDEIELNITVTNQI